MEASRNILEKLRERGFDGVIYRNIAEDPGSVSVLMLDPKAWTPAEAPTASTARQSRKRTADERDQQSPADNFMNQFEDRTSSSRYSEIARSLTSGDGTGRRTSHVEIYPVDDDRVTLEYIESDSPAISFESRGSGSGSNMLRTITEIADKNGVIIEAVVSRPMKFKLQRTGLDTKDLVDWYVRHGFEVGQTIADGAVEIYREPSGSRNTPFVPYYKSTARQSKNRRTGPADITPEERAKLKSAAVKPSGPVKFRTPEGWLARVLRKVNRKNYGRKYRTGTGHPNNKRKTVTLRDGSQVTLGKQRPQDWAARVSSVGLSEQEIRLSSLVLRSGRSLPLDFWE